MKYSSTLRSFPKILVWSSVLLRTGIIALSLLLAPLSRAAVKTWDGSTSANWSIGANWTGNVAPVDGDDLVFPLVAFNQVNTNNIAGLQLNSITFNTGAGYTLRGNAVVVSNGIAAQQASPGVNTVVFNVTCPVDQTFSCVNAGALLNIDGNIAIGQATLTVSGAGSNIYSGIISGGRASLIKSGNGVLRLDGPSSNTYGGSTTVNGGLVELNKLGSPVAATAIPGNLVINAGATVRLLADAEIDDTSAVTVNGSSILSGLLSLNNNNDLIGDLTLVGGDVTTGTGTLTLGGDLAAGAVGAFPTVNTVNISGNLSLGSATRTFNVSENVSASPEMTVSAVISGAAGSGLIKTGAGSVRFSGINTYTGLTTISNGFIFAATASTFGSGAAGTEISGSGSLLIEGVTIANESLTNNEVNADFQASGGVTSVWASNIVLNADISVQVFTNGLLVLSNRVSGVGGITKTQPGTLRYAGSPGNNYTGNTVVNEGVLQLGKSTLPAISTGQLIIGDGVGGVESDVVRYIAGSQLFGAVQVIVNKTGLLDINNLSDDVSGVTLNGGHIQTGSGGLSLLSSGDITATSSDLDYARISGQLNLSSAIHTITVSNAGFSPDLLITANVTGSTNITKSGDGELSLSASNSFSGQFIAAAGSVRVAHNFAFGSTNAGVIVSNGASVFLLGGTQVGSEPITLNGLGASATIGAFDGRFGSNSWAGPITLASDTAISVPTNDVLNLIGPIGGNGALAKILPGKLIFSGVATNSYTNNTVVFAGTLELAKSVADSALHGPLIIGDGIGGTNADVVRLVGGEQLRDSVTPVTVSSSGHFDMNGINEWFGSLSGNGRVTLGATTSRIGLDNSSTTFSGLIAGTGGFMKTGAGTMTLSGNNTYAGTTIVNSGVLLVNGLQPQSPVSVTGGTLGGTGTVGHVTASALGSVAPGASPGILTTSNFVMSATNTLNVEINGPNPGTNYDQLNVRGTNGLGNAALNVILGGSFTLADGQQFVIITNDGADAITGTFVGLPNNSIVSAGNLKFRINYDGGSGNDVTLTFTNPPVQITGGTVSSGNGNGVVDPNECNNLSVGITNTTGTPMTGITATLSSSTPQVIVTQPQSAYPDIAVGGRTANKTPFQISTTPYFPCASNIDLTLTVNSSAGSFALPITLPSGEMGGAQVFSNGTAKVIPDANFIYSTNVVSGIVGPVKKVTVSVYITHANVGDLHLMLIGPDSTAVSLSQFNGGTGDDYGTDCAPASQTTFDDAAATAITAGSAPYVGTFRPQGSLAAFNGKENFAVNGEWRLSVEDDFPGTAGTLRCWELAISGTECAAGGGLCDTCLGIVTNTLNTGYLTNDIRLSRDGTDLSSKCAVPKGCPFPTDDSGTAYKIHAYTNAGGPVCVTAYLSDPCGLFAAAYLGQYNPTNLCENYLGDIGYNTAWGSFSFNVPAGTNFLVVVNDIPSENGSCDYTLVVTGTECQPNLNIAPESGNNVRLFWPTTAAGYQLEGTPSLVPSNWVTAPIDPVVNGGNYNVTNNTSATNRFYRLHKP